MEVGDLVEAQFKFWWPADKFGGCGQDLVALVILRSSFGGLSGVCLQCGGVSQQQTQEPPQEVLVVVICKFGGHLVIVEVRCHGWVV